MFILEASTKNVQISDQVFFLPHIIQRNSPQTLCILRRNHHRNHSDRDKATVASEWVEQIIALYGSNPTVVGLDVEWLPNRSRYTNNKSATLQLCINNKCLILQLFYMDQIPDSIQRFLLNPNFTFVGVEVGKDVMKLRNEYGLSCARTMDVRATAKERCPGRFSGPGLKDLAWEVCGLRMRKPKHVCMSNWEARVLNVAQIEYACIDAFASYKIAHKLLSDN